MLFLPAQISPQGKVVQEAARQRSTPVTAKKSLRFPGLSRASSPDRPALPSKACSRASSPGRPGRQQQPRDSLLSAAAQAVSRAVSRGSSPSKQQPAGAPRAAAQAKPRAASRPSSAGLQQHREARGAAAHAVSRALSRGASPSRQPPGVLQATSKALFGFGGRMAAMVGIASGHSSAPAGGKTGVARGSSTGHTGVQAHAQ